MQSAIATKGHAIESSQGNPFWLQGLVVLDSFVLGGCLALILVHDLLTTIMFRLVSGDAQGEILNVLDHLLPYQFGFWGAALFLSALTMVAVRVQTGSWRLAALPVFAFAVLCIVQYLSL